MARLVYDIPTSGLSKQNGTEPASAPSNLKLGKSISDEILEVKKLRKDIVAPSGMSKMPKSRRRDLNKINDNPLLHPLDCKPHDKSLASLSRDSQITQVRRPPRPKAKRKGKSHSASEFEENQSSVFDSEGLSDFVVNDSSSLGDESSDNGFHIPPPRPTRRLVRGLKKRPSDSLVEVGKVRATREDQAHDDGARSSITVIHEKELHFRGINSEVPESNEKNARGLATGAGGQQSLVLLSRDRVISSGLEQAYSLLKSSPSGDRPNHEIFEEAKSETPCSSPKNTQTKLFSPKRPPRIPPAPHRPSVDAFWSQDAINEWNDEYSPRKMPKMRPGVDNGEPHVTLPNRMPNAKPPQRRNRRIAESKKAFVQNRHSMAELFLQELDCVITEGKLSEMAAPTGGIKIIWSKRLNTTAGRANWKLETIRSHVSSTDNKKTTILTYHHHASIELAEKVIDSEDRLLNVIAHEFCHLANFMVSGVKNNPHGKEFKAWAAKCSHVFGNRGIHVTTKHSYDIDYKYVWECTVCGIEFKRHSKSIDTSKHQCGSCKGKLVQIKPKPRSNIVASDYQMFIRNNMKKVKEANPESPQKGIMGLLGKMYKEHKESKQIEVGEKLHGVDIDAEDDSDSEEVTPDSRAIDVVARKLEFLDLTSP